MKLDGTKIVIGLSAAVLSIIGTLIGYIGLLLLERQAQITQDLTYVRAQVEGLKTGKTMEELADYFADKDSLTASDIKMLEVILIRDSE